jgi:hypothetical protein
VAEELQYIKEGAGLSREIEYITTFRKNFIHPLPSFLEQKIAF